MSESPTNMTRTLQIVYYLDKFRHGDADDAFHGLLEATDRDMLPELMAIFRSEHDTRLRGLLVHVIWEHREPSGIPFLSEALQDAEPCVWRQALDGLVALASPAALDALRAAKVRKFSKQREPRKFRRWLDEAIEQVINCDGQAGYK